MAGSYCMFCGTRCFVFRIIPDGPRKGWSGHLATCTKGKRYDREQTDGWDADNTVNPATSENDEPCMCGTDFTCMADEHDRDVAS
jgi:hypothetical protein